MSAAFPSVPTVLHARMDRLNSYLKQDKIFPSDLIMCFSGVAACLSLPELKCVRRKVSRKPRHAAPLLPNVLNKRKVFIVLPRRCLNSRSH